MAPTRSRSALPAPTLVLERRDDARLAGATLETIVAEATPTMPPALRRDLRVVLVTAAGAEVIPAERWTRVRPKPGVKVVIRSVPRGNALRSILMIVVSIAAIALGQLWGVALAGTWGLSAASWTTLITVGVTAIGMLLVNALVPVKKPDDDKQYGGYSINGWKNTSNPDGPIPAPLGRLRMAPYYAAAPYTEIVGDLQYIRAVFIWGYGPLAISDLKFGETPITDYDEVAIEHRYGWPDDEQLTLYTTQVIEEALGVELTRAWPRNDDGSYIGDTIGLPFGGGTGTTPDAVVTIEKPVIRYTVWDASEAAIILGLVNGLGYYDDDGNLQAWRVDVRIRQRALGAVDWTEVTTLEVIAAKTVPFWRQHRWVLPSRGAYEIELTRMTDENKSARVTDRVVWQALQSHRPEYPIAFDRPLALTAMRVKATEQLSGSIDNFTGIVSRIAADWDVETASWITRETRSPAAALRWILQGPASAYPASDAGIDLELLADWSAWCASKGLAYDHVHDAEASLADAMLAVAHAGRATPRHDGRRWGVVIDRPQDLVVDHVNPRNSRAFKWTRTYPKNPDGFRVKFQDLSNDWKASERIVPWPGHVGDVVVTEQLELPGKCDPDEIWIEARRRQYEIEMRPDAIEVTQDGQARVATRGDQVAVSYDVLARTQTAARVARVIGTAVELDGIVEAGAALAMRFRVFAGVDDVIGTSVVRRLAPVEGASKIVRLIGSGDVPLTGDVVHVGPVGEESLIAIVRGEERGDEGSVILHLVAAAPEIDVATDAEVAPAWDGRAGTTYTGPGRDAVPAAPVFSAIATGLTGTEIENGLLVRLREGAGSVAIVAAFEIDHRLAGGTVWTTTTVSAAAGGMETNVYAVADTIEIRARALSLYGVAGPYGPVVTTTIGSADTIVPDVTDLAVTTPTDGLRSYDVAMAASEVAIAGWMLRARPGSGWSWAELVALHGGVVTTMPWTAPLPANAGAWTIGAVAVDGAGRISPHPFEAAVTLPPLWASGTASDRIERALGWPGTISGGGVVGGELAGTAAGTALVYATPAIDLGADLACAVAAAGWGVVGTLVLGMRVGLDADGAPVGPIVPLGATTARWIEIVATVTDATDPPALSDLTSLVRTA